MCSRAKKCQKILIPLLFVMYFASLTLTVNWRTSLTVIECAIMGAYGKVIKLRSQHC